MIRPTVPLRWAAAAAVAAMLGFGTMQAAAAPRAEKAARACTNSYCSWWCVKQGYDGGACVNGECLCVYAE